jgi:indole-3-glycerol phosphate synthase
MLDKIIENKILEVQKLKNQLDYSVNDVIKMDLPKNSFIKSIQDNIKSGKNAIIAELKRCSPSKGYLNKQLDLTDEKFFKGSINDLILVKKTISLPVLRKDFIIDESQIIESKIIGADCILLIVACLTREKFSSLLDFSKSLDLDVLVEVHDEYELDIALEFDCKMIGINNRNLKTFDVSINTSKVLRKKIVDKNIVVISESGIKDISAINSLNESKIYAFLIGESLIINNDPATLLKKLVN